MDVLVLGLSFASLVLAAAAILLSIHYYELGEKQAKRFEDAATSTAHSVDKLETLFSHLYADTFAMLREMQGDVRKHAWPDEPKPAPEVADNLVNEQMSQLQKRMDDEMQGLVTKLGITDNKLAQLQVGVSELVARTITESRQVDRDARLAGERDLIMTTLTEARARHEPMTNVALSYHLRSRLSPDEMLNQLNLLEADGYLHRIPPFSASAEAQIVLGPDESPRSARRSTERMRTHVAGQRSDQSEPPAEEHTARRA